jgi:hypothetical protein
MLRSIVDKVFVRSKAAPAARPLEPVLLMRPEARRERVGSVTRHAAGRSPRERERRTSDERSTPALLRAKARWRIRNESRPTVASARPISHWRSRWRRFGGNEPV